MMANSISEIFLLQAGGGIGFALWPMIFIIGIFYLLLILPQQKRQKRWQHMINDLKTGDRVTTNGGIRGVIIAVKEDALHLRVPPDNLRLEISKASVASVARDDDKKS
jgi:preprotein translocase subunit YajC